MRSNSPKNIGQFKLYTKRPNTISKGSLYTASIEINTQNEDKMRTIRVYLPSSYDFNDENKRYDVLYMMDGKNCFDDYTSFVGEWHADEHLEDDIKGGNKDYIIVGIDAPKKDVDRMQEMLPYNDNSVLANNIKPLGYGYAHLLADFIVNKLSKIIDETFHTNDNKRAIMGSSMGGIFSFYAAFLYPSYFSCCLSYSTAFMLFDSSFFKKEFTERIKEVKQFPDVFLCVGGGDKFEYSFEPLNYFVYKKLRKYTRIQYVYDSKEIHSEKAWDKYYLHAIRFWLDN